MNLQEATVLVELASEFWPSYVPTEEAAAAHADLLSDDDVTFDEARAALRDLAKLGRDFYAGPGAVHRGVLLMRYGLPVDATDEDWADEWQQQQYRVMAEADRQFTERFYPQGLTSGDDLG